MNKVVYKCKVLPLLSIWYGYNYRPVQGMTNVLDHQAKYGLCHSCPKLTALVFTKVPMQAVIKAVENITSWVIMCEK